MLVGSYYMRLENTYIEIRLITPVNGERQNRRMIASFNAIPEASFDDLANQMINLYSNFGTTDLRETEANIAFEQNSRRGRRFDFRSFQMITSSEYKNQILIVITVGNRV